MFSTLHNTNVKISVTSNFSSAHAYNFDMSKILLYGKELNLAKLMISLFDRAENTVEKGENAGHQHFLLFPQCFPEPSSLVSLKVRIV